LAPQTTQISSALDIQQHFEWQNLAILGGNFVKKAKFSPCPKALDLKFPFFMLKLNSSSLSIVVQANLT